VQVRWTADSVYVFRHGDHQSMLVVTSQGGRLMAKAMDATA
jgi:hypothetical protein